MRACPAGGFRVGRVSLDCGRGAFLEPLAGGFAPGFGVDRRADRSFLAAKKGSAMTIQERGSVPDSPAGTSPASSSATSTRGRDDGNNREKPLIAAWRHVWCHLSRRRFRSLNAPWHHGGTTLAPPPARWCYLKRCADNRMATKWHHPFYLALPKSTRSARLMAAIIKPRTGDSAHQNAPLKSKICAQISFHNA